MGMRGTWWIGGVLGGLCVLLVGIVALAGDESKPKSGPGTKPDYIDTMLRDEWQKAKIKPSPAAPDAEFLRRAYLDLTGRIPNIQEALAFLENKDKGKRLKLIEYLLASPDYAKNFGNLWTVLLIGRARQERGVDRDALAGWLRTQVAADRPWNEIAYDLIDAKGSNKENGAVNFPLAHLEFGAVPLTSITTRVFLGQQVQCTQCHDHPTNDWKQADFWGINAFFKGIRRQEVRKTDSTGAEVYDHTELSDEPTDAYSSFDRRNGLVGIAFPTFLDGRKISQGPDVERRKELAKLITGSDTNLPRAFVNRMWGHFMGRGFVNPVDDFGPQNPPVMGALLDRLAADFQASGYDVKALVRWLMSSQAYNLTSITIKDNEKDETLFSHMTLKPMSPEQLFDSLLVATSAHKAGGGGDLAKRRDAWLKQFVTTFGNDEQDESTSFQGTIPQALMMMNGELMSKATGGQAGSFLNDLAEQAGLQRHSPADVYIISRLYLAALSRFPSPQELATARRYFGSFPDTAGVMEDLFWALLNSNEFILNR
jgi:hypothetical protein